MSDKQYEVKVPCLVHVPVHTAQGPQLGTLYAGNVVPAGVPDKKIKAWLDAGLIREVGAAEQEPAEQKQDPEGDDPKAAPEKVTARSPRAELLAYAVAHGDMTQEQAEELTNKQLIAKFAKAE